MRHLLFFLCTLITLHGTASVDKFLGDLASQDYALQTSARAELLKELAKTSAPDAAEATHKAALARVHERLQSNLTEVIKAYLMQLLGLYGDETSTTVLYPFLGDKSPVLRDRARKALAELSQTDAPTMLMAGLLRGPAETRSDFIQALVYIDHKPAWEPITKLLGSTDQTTQAISAWALGQLGVEEALQPLWSARSTVDKSSRSTVETALLQLGPEPEQTAILARGGTTDSVQIGAFKHLASIDPATAISFLEGVLENKTLTARPGIIAAAAASGQPDLETALMDMSERLSDDEKIIVVGVIADQRASEYETFLLKYLNSENPALAQAAADALGWVGSDNSFEAMVAYAQDNLEIQTVADAIARLNAPKADEYFISKLQDTSDKSATLTAIKIIGLRNSPGGTDGLNALALNSTDSEIREASFKALEVIGDMQSIKILLGIIKQDGPLTRPAQISLKRLSVSYGAVEEQWNDAYLPALESVENDKQKELILLILDGVASQPALDYLSGNISNPALKPVVLRTLQRWPKYHVAVTWVELTESDEADNSLRTTAESALRRTFNSSAMEEEIEVKAEWAAKALATSNQLAIKQSIASGFDPEDIKSWKLRGVRNELEPFKNDPDVRELLAPLFN